MFEKLFDLIRSVFAPNSLTREQLKDYLGYNDKTKTKNKSTEELLKEYEIMKAKAFWTKVDVAMAPFTTLRGFIYSLIINGLIIRFGIALGAAKFVFIYFVAAFVFYLHLLTIFDRLDKKARKEGKIKKTATDIY